MNVRLAALFASVSLAAAGAWLTSPAAAAAVTDGQCSTATGVTLVVDFQELGGGRIVKCVEDVAPGTSGLKLLQLAGVTAEGTLHDGMGFTCRINGRPGASENLPVTGSPDYRETCVSTPPKAAFWSYWHADNGGTWSFSQQGGTSREVVPGGYEGWSFSLNRTDTSNTPPGIKPFHPVAAPEPVVTTVAPVPPATTTAPAPVQTPQPTVEAATQPATVAPAPATPSAAPATSAKVVKPPAAKKATEPPLAASSTEASPSPSPTPTPTPMVESADPTPTQRNDTPTPIVGTTPAAPTTSTAPQAAPPVTAVMADDGGPPVGTLVGMGAVASLGLGGGVVWWRRRGL